MTYSELRASDAERERVVAFLREHALLGRLTDDELEDRIGLAYASVTVGDLERLIADLPRANQPAAGSRGPRPPPRNPAARPPARSAPARRASNGAAPASPGRPAARADRHRHRRAAG